MKILTVLILLTFVIFRNSFSILKGKREKKKITHFIYWGRKIIEIGIFYAVPVLLLLEVFPANFVLSLYIIGLIISILGLMLMISTRLNRNTDWGFMGDDAGKVLFTGGPYRLTRHPYYVGAIMVGIGVYFQLHYVFTLLIIPVVIFVSHVIKKEEVFLEKQFGQKFLEYKNEVGLLPWLH